MRTECKPLAINCTPALSFFQLFIFIMIDARWIDLAQFIENKGDCLLFLNNGKSNELKWSVSLILFKSLVPFKRMTLIKQNITCSRLTFKYNKALTI